MKNPIVRIPDRDKIILLNVLEIESSKEDSMNNDGTMITMKSRDRHWTDLKNEQLFAIIEAKFAEGTS